MEIICIFIGEFGINISIPFWQTFCAEQFIDLSGNLINIGKGQQSQSYLNRFFGELPNGKHVPRSIFIDMDESKINSSIRIGPLRNLINQNCIISNKEDAANLFVLGKQFFDRNEEMIKNLIRKEIEKCDHLQGFMVFSSLCGGTGSGVLYELLYMLSRQFCQKRSIFAVLQIPSNTIYDNCIEPYNCVLGLEEVINNEKQTTNILFQNEALQNYCRRQFGIDSPDFSDINKLIVNMVSSLTSCIRFGGTQNESLQSISDNVFFYSRQNMFLPSYYSLRRDSSVLVPKNISKDYADAENSVEVITQNLMKRENCFVDCLNARRRIFNFSYTLRGDNINQKVFYNTAERVISQYDTHFSHYPKGISLVKSYQSMSTEDAQNDKLGTNEVDGVMLQLNSSLHRVLQKIYNKVYQLYRKSAYFNSVFYKYGLDKDYRRNCLRFMESYIQDYKDLEIYDGPRFYEYKPNSSYCEIEESDYEICETSRNNNDNCAHNNEEKAGNSEKEKEELNHIQ